MWEIAMLIMFPIPFILVKPLTCSLSTFLYKGRKLFPGRSLEKVPYLIKNKIKANLFFEILNLTKMEVFLKNLSYVTMMVSSVASFSFFQPTYY
jgi:hypothetical protein